MIINHFFCKTVDEYAYTTLKTTARNTRTLAVYIIPNLHRTHLFFFLIYMELALYAKQITSKVMH